MQSYEFELFDYWDDLEYADDAYWENEVQRGGSGTNKRRRDEAAPERFPTKRPKTGARGVNALRPHDRDGEPLLFRSRDERTRSFFDRPPMLSRKDTFSFLPDWKERFANDDGAVIHKKMPADMRRAAEAKDQTTPPRADLVMIDGNSVAKEDGDDDDDEEEGDWEDEDEGGEEGRGVALDPDVLKDILSSRLGSLPLDSIGGDALIDSIQKMLSGQGDEAAGDLANALLGKITSETGDEALSGWLSQQGVSLDEDGDPSSVAPDSAEGPEAARQAVQSSPRDSAISMANTRRMMAQPTHKSLANGSPSPSKRARTATDDDAAVEGTKTKAVKFDVPRSSSEPTHDENAGRPEPTTSKDALDAGSSVSGVQNDSAKTASKPSIDLSQAPPQAKAHAGKTRKRKAAPEEALDDKPATKKTRSRELSALGAGSEVPSPAPPARRTRSARAKSAK